MAASHTRRTGDDARRDEDGAATAPQQSTEPASCATSTQAGMGRQQGRGSSMAAKAAEVAEGRHGAASDAQGARGGALSTARRHVHEERDAVDTSSSAEDSSNCSSTSVHGSSTVRGEMAGQAKRRQGRRVSEGESGARTEPRREIAGSSSAAAALNAGESSAATKEKTVGGSVNTGNTETELIREQRRMLLRHDIRRDAGKKGARRARYGTIPPVTRGWLEARRVTGGLRWPYTWKRRAAVGAEAARRAPNAGRSEARDALRRASAQSGAYNYEERTRPQRSADAAGERGRRTASTERRPGRGAGKAPMRRMIRMGELGVRAVADIAARETET